MVRVDDKLDQHLDVTDYHYASLHIEGAFFIIIIFFNLFYVNVKCKCKRNVGTLKRHGYSVGSQLGTADGLLVFGVLGNKYQL